MGGLPVMAYTGDSAQKWYLFQGTGILKGMISLAEVHIC